MLDDITLEWLSRHRPDADLETLEASSARPDPGAQYDGGIHQIDLTAIQPMVAHPGDPDPDTGRTPPD